MSEWNYHDCPLASLIGRTIKSVELSIDQRILVFGHDQGLSHFVTSQQCCEQTWISDIIGVQFLLGHKIVAAEAINLPDPKDGRDLPPGRKPRERKEYDDDIHVAHYGAKITTTGGVADIIYRTSTNSCYGGKIEVMEEYDRDELLRGNKLTKLTEDFGV